MYDKILYLIVKLKNDATGATAIEYGLIAAGIAVVIIGGVALIGDSLEATFNEIGDALGG